jgi:hypothetical protein
MYLYYKRNPETHCMGIQRGRRDPASGHGQRVGAVRACRPGACTHGDPACMRRIRHARWDPVRACGDLARAYVRGGPAWAWGSRRHGQSACVGTRCVHTWGSSVHARWGPGACVHAGIRPVRICVGVRRGRGDPVGTGRGSQCHVRRHGGPRATHSPCKRSLVIKKKPICGDYLPYTLQGQGLA